MHPASVVLVEPDMQTRVEKGEPPEINAMINRLGARRWHGAASVDLGGCGTRRGAFGRWSRRM
jgi:hypothetical protein